MTELSSENLDGHPPRRLTQIDSLRGLAILAVLFEHWAGGLRDYVPIGAGTLGVSFFFTLSGFLITGILLEDIAKPSVAPGPTIVAFYVRRFFRLVPAFYAAIAVLAVLGIGRIGSDWLWHMSYLSNVYQALGGEQTVFWSLAVEEQFYLLWPLVLVLTPARYVAFAATAMILFAIGFKAAALLLGYWTHYYLLPGQMEFLGAGSLLAIACFKDGRRNQFGFFSSARVRGFGAVACACFAACALEWLFMGERNFRLLALNTLCGVFFAWLVLMAARGWKGWIGVVLDLAVLRYVGQISYGVYLIHNWMPDILEKFAGPMPKYLAAPIVALLTFGVCAISWRFFEQPLIRYGHGLSRIVSREQNRALVAVKST